MKHLVINGIKEKIPPYPHHKAYIYRTKQFFTAKSLSTHLVMRGFFTIKELARSVRHKTSIPRTLLIDPTTDCNLKCKGCWSKDYEKGWNLSFEKIDDIITQAKKLGIKCTSMSGGEPLLRKDDILKLMAKHRDVAFGVYTNGTLIDEDFADKIKELGNLNIYISIEGTEEETDFRRGEGVYEKVLKAMDMLKERQIAFAFSACYHSKNYKTISSDEFLDFMREKGCWFGWLFNYMPLGKDADMSLVCSAEQRAYVQEKISSYIDKHDYLIIDFWNNGHVAFGCVGGGTGFVHINARGDVEPCAFCHYSDSSIHEVSLLDALKSQFFTSFRRAQPFSENPLRACPLIDVPEGLKKAIENTKAQSTHFKSPETSEELSSKTAKLAEKWVPVADEIYKNMPCRIRKNFPRFLKYYALRKRLTDSRRDKYPDV